MVDVLQIITRVSVFISLVLSIIILVKVSKKWCEKPNEKYMKVKDTYACYGGLGGGTNSYPCKTWADQKSKGQKCVWDDGTIVSEYEGMNSCDTGLACCDQICPKDLKGNVIYKDYCQDNY